MISPALSSANGDTLIVCRSFADMQGSFVEIQGSFAGSVAPALSF